MRKYIFKKLLSDFKKNHLPYLAHTTQKSYESVSKNFSFFNKMEVNKIKSKDIDRWLKRLKKKKYSASRYSFQSELDLISTVFNWFIKNDDRAKLILPVKKRHRRIAFYKEKKEPIEKNYLTEKEFNKFLKSLKIVAPEIYSVAIIQNYQILRISEVLAMKWKYYDSKNKEYMFCESVEFINFKNQKGARIKKGMKNMQAGLFKIRPLRKVAYKTLDQMKKKRDKNSPYIFHDKGNLWTYNQIYYKYEKAFKHAKMPHFSATHIMRRSGASDFLQKSKGDIMALKDMGGWRTLSQVLVYGKLNQDYLKKAIRKIDRIC